MPLSSFSFSDAGVDPMRPRLIPKERMATLAEEIERLARKAEKLGCSPVGYEVLRGVTVRYAVDSVGRKRDLADGEAPRPGERVHVRAYVEVKPFGEAPVIRGWAFAARLEHLGPAGNVIHRSPRFPEELPERFRAGGPVCEHCNLDRRRKDTFVLRHETGAWKRVGRDCLADFLGHPDPAEIVDLAMLLPTLCEALDAASDDGCGGGGRSYTDLDEVLATAAACIRLDGWMSKARAEASFPPVASTSDDVERLIFGNRALWSGSMVEWARARTPTEMDRETARAAREWAKSLPPTASEYESNLRVLAHAGYVEGGLGLAVSMVAAYHREMDKRREREASRPSEWVGTVGERRSFTLRLERVIPVDGYYGMTYLHKFRDEHGNRIAWFASGRRLDGERGERLGKWFSGLATVKEHRTYEPRDGSPSYRETLITRAALKEGEADAPVEKPAR